MIFSQSFKRSLSTILLLLGQTNLQVTDNEGLKEEVALG